jgi:hypothetical protein
MTIPALIIGILFSTLYGAGFHLIRGGGAGRLALYIVFSWAGFWGGHLAGVALKSNFGLLGPLQLGLGTVGSVAALAIGYWLSQVQISRPDSDDSDAQ